MPRARLFRRDRLGAPLPKHGDGVHAVNHFGRHTSEVGGFITVYDLARKEIGTVQIMAIRLVECARLTDREIGELGYDTRAAYLEEWGRTLSKRRAWFMHVIPVSKDNTAH